MPSTYFYEDACKKNQPGSIFPHWNWAAFLLGPYWLAYRRSYFYAFLFLCLEILHTNTIFFISVRILLGFMGTSLYLRKWVKNKVPHYFGKSILALILFSTFGVIFTNALLENPVFPDITHTLKREFHYHYYNERTGESFSIESKEPRKIAE